MRAFRQDEPNWPERPFAKTNPIALVPTLRVGMPSCTLRVPRVVALGDTDAERRGRHSHAERGNELTIIPASIKVVIPSFRVVRGRYPRGFAPLFDSIELPVVR